LLTGDEQVRVSKLWGSHEMHSPHGHHPMAPNKDVLRVSNDPE